MLRVSPDGGEVWVQTAATDTNVVLDTEGLGVLATEPTGRGPITNAWTPDGRYSFVTNSNDAFVSVFDANTWREVKRVEVGLGGSNVAFSGNGSTAFVALARDNVIAVVDVASLDLVTRIPTGSQPMGLIILNQEDQ